MDEPYSQPSNLAICWKHRLTQCRTGLALRPRRSLGNGIAHRLRAPLPFRTHESDLYTKSNAIACTPTDSRWTIQPRQQASGSIPSQGMTSEESTRPLPAPILWIFNQGAYSSLPRSAAALRHPLPPPFAKPSCFALLRTQYLRPVSHLENN